MPILTSACATRPWWVNEWLVIDVGEIFSFLLIGVRSINWVSQVLPSIGASLAFINLFNQPTKFWGICTYRVDVSSTRSGHGGTTEEGNCSYLLPRAAAAGSKGTNKGQIPKVPFDEFARCLAYRMDVTRSQLSANTGIPVCLVREIWHFKVLTGKEVTPLHEEGNSLQFRAGKKATHFRNKWFIDIWQTDKTESKERSQCEIVKWKYVSRCDEQTKTTCLIRPRGDVRNTIGIEWRRLKHI